MMYQPTTTYASSLLAMFTNNPNLFVSFLLFHMYVMMSFIAMASYYCIPVLMELSRHGKTRRRNGNSSSTTTTTTTNIDTDTTANSTQHHDQQDNYWTVPKSWFLHFYLFGLIMVMVMLWTMTTTRSTAIATTTASIVLVVHLLRRCYECMYIHKFGNSRMHIMGYMVGLFHYMLLPWNFIHISITTANDNAKQQPQEASTMKVLIGLFICIIGQYEQYQHHFILSTLRDTTRNATLHVSIPYGKWFNYVSCPHYLAEILIYIGLTIIVQTPQTEALLFWVVTNLCISAMTNHSWYLETFHEYAKLRRTAIIPFLV